MLIQSHTFSQSSISTQYAGLPSIVMDRSQLPSIGGSAYLVPMTPVRRRLAEEILHISLTEVPQEAIREARPTSSSASSDQSGGQGPGSSADQARLQNDRDAHLQVALRSLRPGSIVPESAGDGQDGYEAFADAARDALEDFNQGNAPQSQSSTGTQNLLGTTFFPCEDPRGRRNAQMWAQFRLELLQLEIGLGTEFSDAVNVWLCQIIQSWWDRQSLGKQED